MTERETEIGSKRIGERVRKRGRETERDKQYEKFINRIRRK